MQTCLGCRAAYDTVPFDVPEAMFRTGEVFEYARCPRCDTVQIVEVPADLAGLYDPSRYYSLATDWFDGRERFLDPRLRSALRVASYAVAMLRVGAQLEWMHGRRVLPSQSILDIGCGSGFMISKMFALGYDRVTGVDPFAPEGLADHGFPVHRLGHQEMTGTFDWVVASHVLEHVVDPDELLGSIARLLEPNGRAVVRTPLAGTHAERTYGADWVQLDAPRHLAVFTQAGLEAMVARSPLEIEDVRHDSTDFQFWGSELVRAGVPHSAGPSFTPQQMREWRHQARRLNRRHDGDQVALTLRHPATV